MSLTKKFVAKSARMARTVHIVNGLAEPSEEYSVLVPHVERLVDVRHGVSMMLACLERSQSTAHGNPIRANGLVYHGWRVAHFPISKMLLEILPKSMPRSTHVAALTPPILADRSQTSRDQVLGAPQCALPSPYRVFVRRTRGRGILDTSPYPQGSAVCIRSF